jgi:lycopene cyclase domain-containing protein
VSEKNFLYLILDLGAVIFPLAFSFYPKAPYFRKWKYLFPSMALGSGIFLVWDIAFTKMEVWGFNADYLTGIYLINLPLEEVLFFLFVPYSSIFIYEVVRFFLKPGQWARAGRMISIFLIFFLGIMGILNIDKWYTAVTFLSLSCFLFLSVFRWKSDFLGIFYFSFLFVLIPFFLMNGILTGSFIDAPVVWYNNNENLGLRMGTIPFEDTFYGMLLLLMIVTRMEHLQRVDDLKQ